MSLVVFEKIEVMYLYVNINFLCSAISIKYKLFNYKYLGT